MNEKERKEGLNRISEYYKTSVLEIPIEAERAHMLDDDKNVAGQIRRGKGDLVEQIAKNLVILACEDLRISEDRYNLTHGPIMIELVDTNYIRTRNLLEFDACDYVHELELDTVLEIDGKYIMDIESKSYAEVAMLKRIMLEANMVYQYYPDIAFVLLQLENALGGDYAEDKVRKGSGPAHVIMSQHPNIYLNILTLLDGSRSSSKPIHEPKYYKAMNMSKLRKAYSTIKGLISERVQGDQVFSQRRVYLHDYNVNDTYKIIRRRSPVIGRSYGK